MTKFFNKIRKTLIIESKMGKYLKYAIGEILLVMIGILLALQVSNWNQERLAKDKETLLLSSLHKEFLSNRSQLDTVLVYHNRAMDATRYVISQFPIDPETINVDTLSKNLRGWGYRYTFNPSQGVIRSLVNTSSFNLISNDELRILLVSWEDVLADYQEEEIVAAEQLRTNLVPQLLEHMSYKDGFTDSRVDKEYLSSMTFENLFYERRSNLVDILGGKNNGRELTQITETIDRIIELSKPLTQ